jgi:hypothetical protein
MKRTRQRGSSAGPTLEALAGALFALAPSYLLAESLMAPAPHPTHWIGTAFGVAAGYGLGVLYAARRDSPWR